MKTFVIITLFVVSLVSADFYNSRYDDFDVKPLLENDRILLGYAKCFIDDGPCTPEAKDFKKVIPEALKTACAKCTPKQKEMIRMVVRAIVHKHPKYWEQFMEHYDKEKKYKSSFDEFIEGKDK